MALNFLALFCHTQSHAKEIFIMKIISFLIFVLIFIFGGYGAAISAQHDVEWIEIQDPKSGRVNPALFCHPSPGTKLPAVIYNHGKIIERVGYQGGYDVSKTACRCGF